MTGIAYTPHWLEHDGWRLELKAYAPINAPAEPRPPILLIPGYCMNTFILGFHPRGTPLIGYLQQAGFEVWSANLRGQGESQRVGGERRISFGQLALRDLPAAIDYVLGQTRAESLVGIGCSLGGAVIYSYLAHRPQDHRLLSMVGLGAPLRWDDVHPLVKVAFRSPRLAGALPIAKTRAIARRALPIARKVPKVLSIYMNPDHIDLSRVDQLTMTVDDPNRHLNKQIAHWVKNKDLVVEGLNITQGMGAVNLPLLSIFANADGIVPPPAARSVANAIGSSDLTLMQVGDQAIPFAHADMFINDHVEDRVFAPLVAWLNERWPALATQRAGDGPR